ncbi:MAG: SLC26A/SulP transporter family protein [Rubrivivax sp.]|nr:SLC26A/SulP transporter family protein [Rubrivivax sp.]
MKETARAAPVAPWGREALGALNATAALLPLALSFGLVAFGVAGAAARPAALMATVVAVVLGALAYVLLGRSVLPTAAPSSSAALLLGACVARLVQDPAMQPATPGGLALLFAAAARAVAAGGAGLVLLGLLRAGALVRYVPQPVLAGFMNGVAVLMVAAQLPVLLGIAAEVLARQGVAAFAQWQWPALVAALATAAIGWTVQRRWPRAPAALVALVFGTLVVLGAQALGGAAGAAGVTGAFALPAFGSMGLAWPEPHPLVRLADGTVWAVIARHAPTLAATAGLLALIGALESALNIAAVDQHTNRRTSVNRELVALGAANIVSGLLAGLPVIYLRLRAMTTFAGGGRSWRAALLGCVFLALAFALTLPLIAHVPLAVVGGIVVMLAWGLVDHWTRRLVAQWWRGERTPETQWSLAVVGVVCGVTLVAGFVAAVGAGVLLSMLIFVRAMNRSLVRLRYTAAEIPSRRVYPVALEERLAQLRPRIAVIELEGALFFGNVDRLAQEAWLAAHEGALRAAPVPGATPPAAAHEVRSAPPGFLVLDLRRVSTVDASGAVGLAQLRARLAREGTTMLLAGVTPDNRHGRALQAQGVLQADGHAADGAPWPLHADTDHAIEAAELALLQAAQADLATLAVPPEGNMLLDGVAAERVAQLVPRLVPRRLAAGERLFAQGDPGRSLFLLAEGSVSVLDHDRGQRFVSFSPGMCFGETAVLDGGGRTADALADVPSTVYELPVGLLHELQHDEPELAAQIYRNLALHLSLRLRDAAGAWRLAAG